MLKNPLIFDATGKPISPRATGYDAASPTGDKDRVRAYKWASASDSINTLLAFGGIDTIRSRTREAVRNDPVASRCIDVYVAHAVGGGIKPLPLTSDQNFRDEILEAWADWSENDADSDERLDFDGLTSLVVRSMREGGESFVRFRPRRPSDGYDVPLQLQVLESEFCDSTKDGAQPNGNTISAGVEFTAIGKRAAYWMYKQHPGSMTGGLSSVPVPASEILHIFETLRPGQSRGISSLVASLLTLHELADFQDAELVRKKLAAMFMAFQETPSATESDILGAGSVDTSTDGIELASLEPGTLQLLPPGHSVSFSTPADVGGNYAAFVQQNLRTIAAGCGLTYEQVSGDYSNTNYSSARAALMEFRRQMGATQKNVVIHQFCRPVWRRWFEAAVLSGRLKLPANTTLKQASRVRWITPAWPQVDPVKDIQAKVLAINNGLMSRDQAIGESGIDPETLDEEIARGQRRAKDRGVEFGDPGEQESIEGGTSDE